MASKETRATGDETTVHFAEKNDATSAGDEPVYQIGIVRIEGFERVLWRTILFYCLAVCTAGISLLVCFWFPSLWVRGQKRRVHLSVAPSVLIKGSDRTFEECRVETRTLRDAGPIAAQFADFLEDKGGVKEARVVVYRNMLFVYNKRLDDFTRPEFAVGNQSFQSLRQQLGPGLQRADDVAVLNLLFGANLIDVPLMSVPLMVLTEVLHPFYLFQAFSSAVWWANDYIYYPIAIIVISAAGVIWTVVIQRRSINKLRKLARHVVPVTVHRFGEAPREIQSTDLVPGDVIDIPDGLAVPADLLLISGEVVSNEASLTGESNPVVKQSVPNNNATSYAPSAHKKHTLFCGTTIVQSRANAGQLPTALVIRSGFGTAKGELFFSILFPKPINFKFNADANKYLLVMASLAAAAFIYSAVALVEDGYPAGEVVLSALDLVTIAVPPALPLVLTIGTVFAVRHLKQAKIYCISPPRINFAGKINVMCFDKTGTITDDDLLVSGARPASGGAFQAVEARLSEVRGVLASVLAATHSVSVINGVERGHPVDVAMFQATGWKFAGQSVDRSRSSSWRRIADGAQASATEAPAADPADSDKTPADPSGPESRIPALLTVTSGDGSQRVSVLRRFEFDAALQRMSVVARSPSHSNLRLLVKGSPEAVAAICRPDTLPSDFQSVLRELAQRGSYVLGCAHRDAADITAANLDSVTREDVEHSLVFDGLLIFENRIKPESKGVVAELQGADIRVLMITGDNVYTATHVAREVGMLVPNGKVFIGDINKETGELVYSNVDDPLDTHSQRDILSASAAEVALTGAAIARLFATHDFQILRRTRIFARTSPDQKQTLCEFYIRQGYFVGMCGDGTNDCGALKAAHAGLALSDAEASIVAPFTSKRKTIADVPLLIRHGRGALTTSFVAFKYMCLYPVLQLLSAMRLYEISSTIGDLQYLYDDLFVVLPLATLMCWTKPWPVLGKRRPSSSLLNGRIIASILVQIFITILLMVMMNEYLAAQDWYSPFANAVEADEELTDGVMNQENWVTFTFTNFAYIATALAFSTGPPFRKWFWTNWMYTVALIVTFVWCSLIMLITPNLELFELDPTVPQEFAWSVWGYVWLMFVCCVVAEHVFIEGPVWQWAADRYRAKFPKRRALDDIDGAPEVELTVQPKIERSLSDRISRAVDGPDEPKVHSSIAQHSYL